MAVTKTGQDGNEGAMRAPAAGGGGDLDLCSQDEVDVWWDSQEEQLADPLRSLRFNGGCITGERPDVIMCTTNTSGAAGVASPKASPRSPGGGKARRPEGADLLDEKLQELERELHGIFSRFARRAQSEQRELLAGLRASCARARGAPERRGSPQELHVPAGRRPSAEALRRPVPYDSMTSPCSDEDTTLASGPPSRRSVHLDGLSQEGERRGFPERRFSRYSRYTKGSESHSSVELNQIRMSLEGREARRKEAARGNVSESFTPLTEQGMQARLLQHINSRPFQIFMCMAVFISSVFVGVEVNYAATHSSHSPLGFLYVDIMFMVVFVIELLLRLAAGELLELKNIFATAFDIFVVVSMLANIVVCLVDVSGTTGSVLRFFHLARCLRLVRVVRFVHPLRHLLHSILHTTKSFFWAFALLLTLILFCFGIAITQAVSAYWHEPDTASGAENLLKYWGTLPKAMFTLFKSITGGINWTEVVEDLEEVGQFWVALFTLYIAFNVLAVLNVVTGVFCQSAIESAQNDKELATMELMNNTEVLQRKLTQLFRDIDVDGSGHITVDELENTLQDKTSQAYLRSLGIDAVDAWTLVKLLDVDETGTVDLNEFISGCMCLKGEARAVHIATLAYDQRQMCHALEEFMDSVEKKLAKMLKGGTQALDPIRSDRRSNSNGSCPEHKSAPERARKFRRSTTRGSTITSPYGCGLTA